MFGVEMTFRDLLIEAVEITADWLVYRCGNGPFSETSGVTWIDDRTPQVVDQARRVPAAAAFRSHPRLKATAKEKGK